MVKRKIQPIKITNRNALNAGHVKNKLSNQNALSGQGYFLNVNESFKFFGSYDKNLSINRRFSCRLPLNIIF